MIQLILKLGTLIVNKSTGEFTYSSDASEVVRFKVSDGQYLAEASLTIHIRSGDPFICLSMAFEKHGQNSFALNRGIAGEDMNVSDAISKQVMGQGITVAVVDDGFGNFSSRFSEQYC